MNVAIGATSMWNCIRRRLKVGWRFYGLMSCRVCVS